MPTALLPRHRTRTTEHVATFNWQLEDFSKLVFSDPEHFLSTTFSALDQEWDLRVYPRTTDIGIYLGLRSLTAQEIRYTMRIVRVDDEDDVSEPEFRSNIHRFESIEHMADRWGVANLVTREQLVANGLLPNDTLTIEVTICRVEVNTVPVDDSEMVTIAVNEDSMTSLPFELSRSELMRRSDVCHRYFLANPDAIQFSFHVDKDVLTALLSPDAPLPTDPRWIERHHADLLCLALRYHMADAESILVQYCERRTTPTPTVANILAAAEQHQAHNLIEAAQKPFPPSPDASQCILS